ncbi:MAG: nucleotidyltransferase domain-containing protein [Candidatus Pacearchaeota archaeon]
MEEKSNEEEKYEERYGELLKLKEFGEKLKAEIEKVKPILESFRDEIMKKYNFISAIGLVPPLANDIIESNMDEKEYAIFEKDKQKEKNIFHAIMIIPFEKIKEMPNITIDSINFVKDKKPKIWLHFFTPEDIWQLCFDSRFDYVEAISMSIPIFDTGILGALRVATILKMMILTEFKRYVVSYVLAGSIVRGQATKTSDVDVFVVIDDTDVKKMSRFELRERLRGIIYSYAIEANERANTQNKISPQVYLLTEFWEGVREANPVIFTFIRDGVPLYDRGAFLPWKLLLKMGKIKPSPESIEMFMSIGEKVVENVKRKLINLVTEDIYWGIITPSQGVLMLYGIPPPTPIETVKFMEETFVKKEKLLEENYINILKRIVEIYKKYEHEEIKEIEGKEIDFLLDQISSYIERLKKLAETLQIRSIERNRKEILINLEKLLNSIYGKKSMKEYIKLIKKDFIDRGYISKYYLDSLKKFLSLKKEKISSREFELLRRDVTELIKEIKEFEERKELIQKIKNKIKIKYKENDKILEGELIFGDNIFLIPNILENKIEKFNYEKNDFVPSNEIELKASMQKTSKTILTERIIKALEKRFKDFEIIF